jgi:hypothetical protein
MWSRYSEGGDSRNSPVKAITGGSTLTYFLARRPSNSTPIDSGPTSSSLSFETLSTTPENRRIIVANTDTIPINLLGSWMSSRQIFGNGEASILTGVPWPRTKTSRMAFARSSSPSGIASFRRIRRALRRAMSSAEYPPVAISMIPASYSVSFDVHVSVQVSRSFAHRRSTSVTLARNAVFAKPTPNLRLPSIRYALEPRSVGVRLRSNPHDCLALELLN